MQIKINAPQFLCDKGKRSRNEDSIFPPVGSSNKYTQTFLVCDGVGGAANGEIASQIVANTFGTIFSEKTATSENLHKVLHDVQEDIDTYLKNDLDHQGMGTTLTFLQFNNQGAIIAHAGDSRVYHIRQGEILFRTSDHSLVNDLLKMGKIEEAELAPMNVITRAIQGSSVKKINLDIKTISDIQVNDYFLLCSDGVWGVIPDEKLLSILEKDASDNEKIETINGICSQASKDNFSAYLIKIQEIINNDIPTQSNKIIQKTADHFKSSSQQIVLVENTRKSRLSLGKLLIILLIIGLAGFYVWHKYSEFLYQYLQID